MKIDRLFIFVLLLALCPWNTYAKTTYIPTYFTRIDKQGVTLKSDSTGKREMVMMAEDGRYGICVIHDTLTQDRLKAIKSLKRAEGFAEATIALTGFATILQPLQTGPDALIYTNSVGKMVCSSELSAIASKGVSLLERMPVNIRIENYSNRELEVNDLKRGLSWFILPGRYVNLTVGNPEINEFRILYADSEDQKKDYVTVIAGNVLAKRTIVLEDNNFLYYENKERKEYKSSTGETYVDEHVVSYEKVDKLTFDHTILSIEDFKNLKKNK